VLPVCAVSAEPLLDPTQPYSENSIAHANSRPAAAQLKLEAILHSDQRRLAIVNGQLVHEGDRVGDNLIENITQTTLRYSNHGQQHTLMLANTTLPEKQLSIRPAALIQLAKDTQP
jgi:hypothetical protein